MSVTLRLPRKLLLKIDAAVEAVRRKNVGQNYSRSDLIRLLLASFVAKKGGTK